MSQKPSLLDTHSLPPRVEARAEAAYRLSHWFARLPVKANGTNFCARHHGIMNAAAANWIIAPLGAVAGVALVTG